MNTKKNYRYYNTKKTTKNKKNTHLYISKYLPEPIETIVVEKIMSDEDISKKEGTYFDNKYYFKTITQNTDCIYYDENGHCKVLFRFRKNVIDEDESQLANLSWKKYAMKLHDNRGAAAGMLDRNKLPKYVGKLENPDSFRSKYTGTYTNIVHKQLISNLAASNIIGYYDKFDRNIGQSRIPCRLTAFNVQHKDLWLQSLPYIKKLNFLFKELMPKEYTIQYKRAQETEFVIDKTAYSTLTINHNWRTALHRDKGDLKQGFGNLTVVEEGEYQGGCLGFPQFGIKNKGSLNIDIRTGDFLAMDVHQWHCNTEIIGKTKDYSRLSIVAYLRENMIQCKNIPLKE